MSGAPRTGSQASTRSAATRSRRYASSNGKFPDSGYVFATERGGPFTPDAANRLIKRIGERAGVDFPVHYHMLRHGCGYALANAGHDTRAIQDWLGHRSIQHIVQYTKLSRGGLRTFGATAFAAVLRGFEVARSREWF